MQKKHNECAAGIRSLQQANQDPNNGAWISVSGDKPNIDAIVSLADPLPHFPHTHPPTFTPHTNSLSTIDSLLLIYHSLEKVDGILVPALTHLRKKEPFPSL